VEWLGGKKSFIQKDCPKQQSLTAEQKNVLNTPLINHEKVYLPQVHIKLGLIKNFVKIALD